MRRINRGDVDRTVRLISDWGAEIEVKIMWVGEYNSFRAGGLPGFMMFQADPGDSRQEYDEVYGLFVLEDWVVME